MFFISFLMNFLFRISTTDFIVIQQTKYNIEQRIEKLANDLRWSILRKKLTAEICFIVDVWQGSEYTSEANIQWQSFIDIL